MSDNPVQNVLNELFPYFERLEALVNDILHETPDTNGEVYGILVSMFKAPAYLQGPGTTTPAEDRVTEEGDL